LLSSCERKVEAVQLSVDNDFLRLQQQSIRGAQAQGMASRPVTRARVAVDERKG
jgi:hypothetical protein